MIHRRGIAISLVYIPLNFRTIGTAFSDFPHCYYPLLISFSWVRVVHLRLHFLNEPLYLLGGVLLGKFSEDLKRIIIASREVGESCRSFLFSVLDCKVIEFCTRTAFN